jgi:predicted RNase H-like HicB family nuclease
MVLYDLTIQLEELEDGSDYRYMATSLDLPGLIVVGDTPDEVIALAPQVASALIASIRSSGDKLPETLHAIHTLPHTSHLTVTVPA